MADTSLFVPVSYVSKNAALMQTKLVGEKGSGRFILPMGRVVFAALKEKSISQTRRKKLKEEGKEVDVEKDGSYSIAVVLHPDADISPLREQCEQMAVAAFGKKVGIKMPWSNADEKHEPDALGVVSLEGFKKINANSYNGPIVVKDALRRQIPNDDIPTQVYNGAFVRVEVKCATFDNESKGLKLYLQGVQIVRNDLIRAPKIIGGTMGGEDFDEITEDDDAAMEDAFA